MFALGLVAVLAFTLPLSVQAAGNTVKLSGTRFEMEVPKDWAPGYKDLDDKLLMIYFTSKSTGASLEGVYLRKVQPETFTLADFKAWRIGAEDKRYEGKDHKVAKEGEVSIGGGKGNYLMTTWNEGGKPFVKHTAQFLIDGHQYMVVLSGPKGKVNKAVFDKAVASFALAKQ